MIANVSILYYSTDRCPDIIWYAQDRNIHFTPSLRKGTVVALQQDDRPCAGDHESCRC